MRMFLRHHRGWFFLGFATLALLIPGIIVGNANYASYGTAWAFAPPLIALLLLIATKEPISSLFAGILSGVLLGASCRPELVVDSLFTALTHGVGARANLCILGSVILFGCIMTMVARSGGISAFGELLLRHVRTKRIALLIGAGLNLLFFFDDSFGSLAVGGAMRPLADRLQISRAKLAYALNATSASICALIPLTSWAATAAAGTGEETLYASIGLLFYPMAALAILLFVIITDVNVGPMHLAEKRASNTTPADISIRADAVSTDIPLSKRRGRASDFIAPLLAILFSFIFCFFYTGHLWQKATVLPAGEKILLTAPVTLQGAEGETELPAGVILTLESDLTYNATDDKEQIVSLEGENAIGVIFRGGAEGTIPFSATVVGEMKFTPVNASAAFDYRISFKQALISADPAGALLLGMGMALIFTIFFFVARRTLNFSECMTLIPAGMRATAPTLLLLVFAWMFGYVCRDCMGLGAFFAASFSDFSAAYILPFLLFLAAGALSFSTGSMVGSFSVFLPIAVSFPFSPVGLLYAIAAVISGSVFGNQASLVSSTTLLAAAGAECDAWEHVSTQFPFVLVGGASAALGFLVGGASESRAAGIFSALGGLLLGILLLFLLHMRRKKEEDRNLR